MPRRYRHPEALSWPAKPPRPVRQVWYIFLKKTAFHPAGAGWERRKGGRSRDEAKERLEYILDRNSEGFYAYGWIIWDGERR